MVLPTGVGDYMNHHHLYIRHCHHCRVSNAHALTWVTASKHGVELGFDCLGGCCYESIEDFVKSGDYYDDMKAESISEANKTLLKLTS